MDVVVGQKIKLFQGVYAVTSRQICHASNFSSMTTALKRPFPLTVLTTCSGSSEMSDALSTSPRRCEFSASFSSSITSSAAIATLQASGLPP